MRPSKGLAALRLQRFREREPVALVPVQDPPLVTNQVGPIRHVVTDDSVRPWVRLGLYLDELVHLEALVEEFFRSSGSNWTWTPEEGSRRMALMDAQKKMRFSIELSRVAMQPCPSGEDRG